MEDITVAAPPRCKAIEIILSRGRDTVNFYECKIKVPGIPINIIAYGNGNRTITL